MLKKSYGKDEWWITGTSFSGFVDISFKGVRYRKLTVVIATYGEGECTHVDVRFDERVLCFETEEERSVFLDRLIAKVKKKYADEWLYLQARVDEWKASVPVLVTKTPGYNRRTNNPFMGRPAIGSTRKVSLALPDDVWSLVDDRVASGESMSAVLRDYICSPVNRVGGGA